MKIKSNASQPITHQTNNVFQTNNTDGSILNHHCRNFHFHFSDISHMVEFTPWAGYRENHNIVFLYLKRSRIIGTLFIQN